MSARLTLLLLCDQSDLYSLLMSAMISADFQVVVAHSTEQAKRILLSQAVDAVMIWHNGIPDGSLVGAELKQVAPRTPVILFGKEEEKNGPTLGIDSVCRGDFQDEFVARAVANFFRQTLAASRPRGAVSTRDKKVGFRVPGSNPQLAV